MTGSTSGYRVGFIGLGMMGRGLAKHVLEHGHCVALMLRSTGSEQACADLTAGGAQVLKTPAEVAAVSDVIIICVTGSEQVEEVVFGEQGILHTLRPNCVVVDCSTALPDSSRHIAEAIASKNGKFIDAALTGTPNDANEGTVNLLVGGDPDVLECVRPLLALFAKNIYYCGAVGAGHTIKLLHQFVVLGNAAILSEAFSCAGKAGVNLELLCEVIASGGANSTAFQRIRPYVLEGNDQLFRFSLANAHKDIHYYTIMAGEARAVSFLGDAVHNAYKVAGNFGLKTQFVSHLIRSFNILNGAVEPASDAGNDARPL